MGPMDFHSKLPLPSTHWKVKMFGLLEIRGFGQAI